MQFPELQELKTPRLILRKFSPEDAPLYFQRITSRPEVTRYMLWEPHNCLEQTVDVLAKIQDRYTSSRCYRWCISLAEDHSPIGSIELLRFNEKDESCSFAYMIGADFWGMGFGTEALQAALCFAFEVMGARTVFADHMAANPASGSVMRKAGMSFCCNIPQKYEKNGQKMDACVYRITREQWKIQKQYI